MTSHNLAKCLAALAILWASLALGQAQSRQTATYPPGKLPGFTFSELVSLSSSQPLPEATENKLSSVLHSLVLDNSAPAPPPPLRVKNLGPSVRMAEWNIERGENFDWVVLALKDEKTFRSRVEKHNPEITPAQLDKVTEEAHILQQASVLVLNEVDLGMTRSHYHDVARELAAALKMNFVFGAEFVEVDPLKLGTEELTDSDVGGDQELKTELEAELKADPARYQGLHGSAILSRYPISNVRLQRLPECYDWFQQEISSISKIEQGKRVASDKIFLEKIEREIRRGGRIAIVADLKVEDTPGGTVTVVNAHLENKCPPACRRKQMKAILEGIQGISNPVIVSGDMNTTGADGANLSLAYIAKKTVTDYRFWAAQALRMGTPIPSLFALNYFKNYNDPTARDIKVLANNKEAAFFSDLEKFRFADQGQFDFRGERRFAINGTRKRLANSNQRGRKGFVYTFSLPRDFKGFYGRFKLDWFFIKPGYQNGKRTEQLAPAYARTMVSLNKAPEERISDHSPITVDLPLKTRSRAKHTLLSSIEDGRSVH
jgi:endonuclease/exonuclease/phosphatase family metal-dependent hydrolase